MPIYHGTTIGSGVVIVSPATIGNDGDLMISKGDGSSAFADPTGWGSSYFDSVGSAAAVQAALDAHEADQNNPHNTTPDLAAAYAWTGAHSHSQAIALAGANFGSVLINVPAASAAAVDLGADNHQILNHGAENATVTVTLTRPPGAASGVMQLRHGLAPQKVTWAAAEGSVIWWTPEPDTSLDDASSTRPISWWSDGVDIYLMSLTQSAGGGGGVVDWVNVQDYGADGVASEDDDTPSIEAAIAALPAGGGTLYFPAGTYTLVTAVDLPSNITVRGDGYGTLIRSGLTKWVNRGDGTGLGMFSWVSNSTRVLVTDLRMDAREAEWNPADITGTPDYPKLLYAQANCSKFTVQNCWFENCTFEGIWNAFVDSLFTNNHFRRVGICENHTHGGWVSLPALQPTGDGNVIANNTFDACGDGIGLFQPGVACGNSFQRIKRYAIGAGDASGDGTYIIANNLIQCESAAAHETAGVNVGGVTASTGQALIIGNQISVKQENGHGVASGLRLTNIPRVKAVGNTITVSEQGYGINCGNGGSVNRSFELIDNTVIILNEARASTAFFMIAWNGRSDQLLSRGNVATGATLANSSFAFLYTTRPDATSFLEAVMDGDRYDGGQLTLQHTNGVSQSWGSDELANRYLSLASNPASVPFFNQVIEAQEWQDAEHPNGLTWGIPEVNEIDVLQQGRLYAKNKLTGAGSTATIHTIKGGKNGDRLLFYCEPAKTSVTFEHGTGNIFTRAGTDIILASAGHNIVMLFCDGTSWHEV